MNRVIAVNAHLCMLRKIDRKQHPRLAMALLRKAKAIRESEDWREAAATPLREFVCPTKN